jgi:hypothetical protein
MYRSNVWKERIDSLDSFLIAYSGNGIYFDYKYEIKSRTPYEKILCDKLPYK